MNALTTSPVPQAYAGRRHYKKSDHRPIPHLWYSVVSYHLAGSSTAEIQELTGYSPAMIYRILADERAVTVRQQIMKLTEQEFEALFGKVVASVRAGLNDNDIDTRLKASDMWLKAHGKYQKKDEVNVHITAEDVVFQILNDNAQGQVNLKSKA